MRFEWHDAKNEENQRKHDSLDFETAALVFDDPLLILRKDEVVEGEQRWHAIGNVQYAVLLVVHVYRRQNSNGEEIIRIISAREADKRERRIYFSQEAD